MGVDLAKMTERFSKGLEFSSSKDDYELDYGVVEVPFGRVIYTNNKKQAQHWGSLPFTLCRNTDYYIRRPK